MRLAVLTVAVVSGALFALPAYGLGLWSRTPAARWSGYVGRHRDTPGCAAQVGWLVAQRQALAHQLWPLQEPTQELPVVRRLAIGWRETTVEIPVVQIGQPVPDHVQGWPVGGRKPAAIGGA